MTRNGLDKHGRSVNPKSLATNPCAWVLVLGDTVETSRGTRAALVLNRRPSPKRPLPEDGTPIMSSY